MFLKVHVNSFTILFQNFIFIFIFHLLQGEMQSSQSTQSIWQSKICFGLHITARSILINIIICVVWSNICPSSSIITFLVPVEVALKRNTNFAPLDTMQDWIDQLNEDEDVQIKAFLIISVIYLLGVRGLATSTVLQSPLRSVLLRHILLPTSRAINWQSNYNRTCGIYLLLTISWLIE